MYYQKHRTSVTDTSARTEHLICLPSSFHVYLKSRKFSAIVINIRGKGHSERKKIFFFAMGKRL